MAKKADDFSINVIFMKKSGKLGKNSIFIEKSGLFNKKQPTFTEKMDILAKNSLFIPKTGFFGQKCHFCQKSSFFENSYILPTQQICPKNPQ